MMAGLSNADFIKQHARPGRIGLCGGRDWINKLIRKAQAPLTPEKSVAGLRKVVSGLKKADSGKFLSHDGSEIPW